VTLSLASATTTDGSDIHDDHSSPGAPLRSPPARLVAIHGRSRSTRKTRAGWIARMENYIMDENRAVYGDPDELRQALDRALAAASQPKACPTGYGRHEYLAALTAAQTDTDLEEASAIATQAAMHAVSIGDVHAMNGLVSVANATAARFYATLVDPTKFRVAKGQLGDINLTRAWLAVKAAEDAATAAIAVAE
jgi:hypothetical protein